MNILLIYARMLYLYIYKYTYIYTDIGRGGLYNVLDIFNQATGLSMYKTPLDLYMY